MMNNLKKIFFTSDWHIGHKNILDFSERPFKDLDHMHQVLVNNYNSTVPEDGVCYFLGDMGMCSQGSLKRVMDQLHGTKVCILGNHDKNINAMYRLGFDVVLYGAVLYIANERVTLSHCPLRGVFREDTTGMRGADGTENWHGENREKNQRMTFADEGQFHLHGHVHSDKSECILGRQMDVGIDANGNRPVFISKIESWIAKTRQNEKD